MDAQQGEHLRPPQEGEITAHRKIGNQRNGISPPEAYAPTEDKKEDPHAPNHDAEVKSQEGKLPAQDGPYPPHETGIAPSHPSAGDEDDEREDSPTGGSSQRSVQESSAAPPEKPEKPARHPRGKGKGIKDIPALPIGEGIQQKARQPGQGKGAGPGGHPGPPPDKTCRAYRGNELNKRIPR